MQEIRVLVHPHTWTANSPTDDLSIQRSNEVGGTVSVLIWPNRTLIILGPASMDHYDVVRWSRETVCACRPSTQSGTGRFSVTPQGVLEIQEPRAPLPGPIPPELIPLVREELSKRLGNHPASPVH